MGTRERGEALEAAALDGASQAIKALLLLNGGASIALIAFVGSLASTDNIRPEFVPLVGVVTRSLGWFAVGAGAAVMTSILAYWTNQAYANAIIANKSWRRGVILNNLAGTVGVFSLFCFGAGVFQIATSLPPA